MRLFFKIFIGFTCIILSSSVLKAQESPTASGGLATGTSGTLSYSVGQVFYKSQTGTHGNTITQGVQQPYEISVVTEIQEASNITISTYPNPTTNYLTIAINDYKSRDLYFSIIDVNGQILQEGKIQKHKTIVKTGNWVAGTYFIKIANNKKDIKIFKIIKTSL